MLKRTSPVARKVVSNFLREPAEQRTYAQALEHCNKHNVDMASQLSSDFLLVQSKLVKYRIARLGAECRYVAEHPFGSFPSAKNTVVHATALFVVFTGAHWFGRYSVKPLVEPPRPEEPAPAAAGAVEGTPAEGTAEENAVA